MGESHLISVHIQARLERQMLIVFIIVDYVKFVKEQEMQFARQPFSEPDSWKVF